MSNAASTFLSTDAAALPGKRHIPALDGVRAMAILLVILNHCVCFDQAAGPIDKIFYTIARSAWCGVDLFFVLSGFLITGILLETKARVTAAGGGAKAFFLNFYMRRTLRIFPPYYLLLFISFVLVPWLLPNFTGLDKQAAYGPAVFVFYLQNLWIAVWKIWPGPMLTPTWSLAIEEQFYLGWPLIVFLTTPRQFIRVALGCMAFALAWRTGVALMGGAAMVAYTPTWARMDALAMGGLIAAFPYAGVSLAELRSRLRPLLWLATAGLFILFFMLRGWKDYHPLMFSIGYTLLALLFGWGLLAADQLRRGNPIHTLLTHTVLLRIGQWSYTLYLVHHPIREALRQYVWHFEAPLVAGSLTLGALWFGALMLVLGLILAAISWFCFERPILSLKRFFPR